MAQLHFGADGAREGKMRVRLGTWAGLGLAASGEAQGVSSYLSLREIMESPAYLIEGDLGKGFWLVACTWAVSS